MTTFEAAAAYLRGGISVFPVRRDGSKAPDLPAWNPFRERHADDTRARAWWQTAAPPGIAAVCGAISGGLEVIDFDREADAVFPAWCAMVEEECPGLLSRVCIVRTPRRPDGRHVWLRCPSIATPGNAKLAMLSPAEQAAEREAAAREGRKAELCLVETRGEGGYALVPGCPAECHATGGVYEHVGGPALPDLPTVTPDQREVLMSCARYFDREAPAAGPAQPPPAAGEVRPGDDFDARGPDWAEILLPHGWALAGTFGRERRWRRPGKSACWSATTGHCRGRDGADLLRVFSDNAAPFEAGKAYGKFRAYCALNHGGDFSAAAKALAAQGYGSGRPAPRPGLSGRPPEAAPARRVATIDDLVRAGSQVEWLWPGWVQRGVLTALAAEGGVGKTRFCADLVRRVRHGLPWPDGSPMTLPPDSLALWVVSDNHHDEMVTLSRTFDIAGAVRLNAWAEDPYGGVSLDAAEDLADLDARIAAVRPALVVVDTVGNATDRNLSRQEDAKAFYFPLQLLARKHRCAVLCLTHLNASGKFLGRRVLEKVRVAIRMERPDPADERRSLGVAKSNSKRPADLGVSMGDAGNEYDADPPKAPDAGAEPGAGGPAPGKIGQAVEWLAGHLATGARPVGNTRTAAEGAGIGVGTLYAAVRRLKVEEFELQGRKWWRLPPQAEEIE